MEAVVEKIITGVILLLVSGIGSGAVTLITLKFAYRKQSEDILAMKVSMKGESKLLHDRITKKDTEHKNELHEIRNDIKQILIGQAQINGFIDGLKTGDRRKRA